jgi:hypothetical protein
MMDTEKLKSTLIDSLQRELDFTQNRLAESRKENFLLKRTVKAFLQTHLLPIPAEISLELPDEPPESWAEKSKRFKPLLQAICEVVDNFVKEYGHAAHYDDIITVLSKNPRYRPIFESIHSDPHGTVTARCRDLRKAGYLESPQEAHFIPGTKRLSG